MTFELKEEPEIFDIDEKKLGKLLVLFLQEEPFFSDIIRAMRKYKTLSIPTAGVAVIDGTITLMWNPDFVSSLSRKHFFGLMKHECYHLIFKHVTSRKQEPHTLWNIATDLAINSIIPENELPEGGLIPGKRMKSPNLDDKDTNEKANKLVDLIASFPRNKASEWYMGKLTEDPDIEEAAKSMFEDGDMGVDVHIEGDGSDLSESDRELLEANVKKVIKQASEKAQKSNNWGSVPSELRKEIISGTETVIDWKRTLQYFCGSKQKAKKSRTFRRINRKYPYIHPGRKTNHTSNIAVYIDQSGSVGDDDLGMFFAALSELSRDVTFTIYNFDYGVDENSRFVWKKNKSLDGLKRTRSGGTCFNAVETHYRKVAAEFDGYIVMTDGCAPKPANCISKRCWVILPGYNLHFNPDERDCLVKMTR